MTDSVEELRTTALALREVAASGKNSSVQDALDRLEAAAADVERAWSGSSLGYHACVYYADLAPPPPGAHFSQEWGFLGQFQGTTGDWREYKYEDVYQRILEMAGNPDTELAVEVAEAATRAAEDGRATIMSILTAWLSSHDDSFVSDLKEKVEQLRILSVYAATEAQLRTGHVITRDSTAVGQGPRSAPHQGVIGLVVGLRSPLRACEELADHADRAAAHLERMTRRERREERQMGGTSIFIGHGGSLLWRELKDFISDRLGLPWDEFNRVPVAGVTNVERLVQMLDESGMAFLVLTAEDEKADGSMTARLNVIHEAGLFQGRLGFARAIVLLEEGCEEFSNIAGLGQIRFPAGNIAASFEEVRRVLEREGFVS